MKMLLGWYKNWLKFCIFLAPISVSCSENSSGGAMHTYEGNIEAKLIHNILSNVNTLVRPVKCLHHTVQVKMDFNLISIVELDQKKEILSTNSWLSFVWQDDLISWNTSDYKGIMSVTVPQEKIWLPEIVVDNSVKEYKKFGSDGFLVEIENNGTIYWEPGDIFQTQCSLDITKYPFDTQICHIRFATWTYDKFQVNLSVGADSVLTTEFVEDGEWKLVATSADRYEIESDNLSALNFTLILKRRPMFYILNIIFPVALLSGLSVIVFLLPGQSGEKISLCVTLLVSFTVYLSFIADTIPRTSNNLSILALVIDWYLFLSALSVAVAAISLNIRFRKNQHVVPHYIKASVYYMQPILDTTLSQKCRSMAKNNKVGDKKSDDQSKIFATANSRSSVENQIPASNEKKTKSEREQNDVCTCRICSNLKLTWPEVGDALDRILFWLFLITSGITTVVTILVLSM